jgi:hypothetical protein
MEKAKGLVSSTVTKRTGAILEKKDIVLKELGQELLKKMR